MFSSLTQVVRHIDSLTIDYRRQSTFWGDFSSFLQVRRAMFQAQIYGAGNSVYCCRWVLGIIWAAVLLRLPRCCRVFGRVSMFADWPGACAFQFSPPKASITRPRPQGRTDANFRCSHSSFQASPRSTRAAVAACQSRHLSSPAIFTSTKPLSEFS